MVTVMEKNEREYLREVSLQEKRFDALYRRTAALFGLSDCGMWVLYFLHAAEKPLSQQDLIERMMFPKQTVNSAVSKLARQGLVELRMIPGTRNRKNILLTADGQRTVAETVARMLAAEERAVARFGKDSMEHFIRQYRAFFEALEAEFQAEGI